MNEAPNPFDPGYFGDEDLRSLGFGSLGSNVRIARNCTLIGLSNIRIGSNVRIDGGTVISANAGSLDIGNYIHIGGGGFFACAGGITLADFSNFSQGVRIYSVSDDYSGQFMTNPTVPKKYLGVTTAPVAIERHVIIGSGSVVLPGVVVGEGAAVGALSLVKQSIEGWGVYAGTPVRRLKARSRALLDLEDALRAEQGFTPPTAPSR